MDSFICKLSTAFLGLLSKDQLNTNFQVFYILISPFEVVRSIGLMFNYFRLVLTLLHANVKTNLIIFS